MFDLRIAVNWYIFKPTSTQQSFTCLSFLLNAWPHAAMACMGQRPAKGKERHLPWQHTECIQYTDVYSLMLAFNLCCMSKHVSRYQSFCAWQDASSRKSRDGQLGRFGLVALKVVLLSASCPHPHQGMQMIANVCWPRATPKNWKAWIPNSLSKVDWCQIYVKLHADNDCMVNIEFRERSRPHIRNLNCSIVLLCLYMFLLCSFWDWGGWV